MFTKTQLIEKGKHYFDEKSVNVMFATSDGNFFYEASKSYGDSHAKTKNIELFEIKRSDLGKAKEVDKTKDVDKTEDVDELTGLKKVAKGLKIKGYHLMGVKRLKEEIELKK
ncbi:MAG: hypothetical protein ACUZ8E_15255 [Candidatus Anammoxibacter sp.]